MPYSVENKRSEAISESFLVAKFLAIVLVISGHYFEGSPLWIPVTIGLFVFSFSSGYFTAERYSDCVDIKQFWIGKLQRLLIPLMVVNVFLLLLFLFQGRENVAHLHTVLAWFGLSGILDWLSIKNKSPFGNGLWFFTLLLIFYSVFPLLNFFCKTKRRAWAFVIFLSILCIGGQIYASPPYMLWLTVFGFGFGVFVRRVAWYPSYGSSRIVFFLCGIVFVLANAYGYKQVNLLLVAILSIAVVAILMNLSLSKKNIGVLAILLPCVFEIYLIHTYLFISLQWGGRVAGFLTSVFLILLISYLLASGSKYLIKRVLYK